MWRVVRDNEKEGPAQAIDRKEALNFNDGVNSTKERKKRILKSGRGQRGESAARSDTERGVCTVEVSPGWAPMRRGGDLSNDERWTGEALNCTVEVSPEWAPRKGVGGLRRSMEKSTDDVESPTQDENKSGTSINGEKRS